MATNFKIFYNIIICITVCFFSELLYGRRQAAYTRHVANKDSTGKMAESLNHLKALLEKSRKAKNQDNKMLTNNKAHKNVLKRNPSFTIDISHQLKEAILQSTMEQH